MNVELEESIAPGPWFEFWAWIERGEIRVPVCRVCGAANWYPSTSCRSCPASEGFDWTALSGEGEVFLAMAVHRDFTESGEVTRYTVALVQPDDHPSIRLLAFMGSEPPPAAGARGRLVVGSRAGSRVPMLEVV